MLNCSLTMGDLGFLVSDVTYNFAATWAGTLWTEHVVN